MPCGVTVSIAITDLQEMRETFDRGMGDLQAKQGRELPKIPAVSGRKMNHASGPANANEHRNS